MQFKFQQLLSLFMQDIQREQSASTKTNRMATNWHEDYIRETKNLTKVM